MQAISRLRKNTVLCRCSEKQIKARYENIVNAFINYLRDNDLLL